MKLVMVEWDDITSHALSWVSRDDICDMNTTKCVTVGILCERDDTQLKVCLSINHSNTSQVIVIPRSCITRWRYLKVKEE